MASKRQINSGIKRLQQLKTWQLLILLLLALLVTASFLRLNNIGMVERRAAVLSADKAGDDTALANNLYALQRYSASHMNASPGVIYLEYSYKRDVEKAIEQAKKGATVNEEAIRRADETCKRQFPGYSQAYVQCNLSEQEKFRSGSNAPLIVEFPNPELYRHTFVSPAWSPDFAGWSVVVSFLVVLFIFVRLVSLGILKLLLHRYYQNI